MLDSRDAANNKVVAVGCCNKFLQNDTLQSNYYMEVLSEKCPAKSVLSR